jgi:CheY-like chemotaxis protein
MIAQAERRSEKNKMDGTDKHFPLELPARVLVVEDNPEHSFIAVRVLHQLLGEGSEVIVAETADEALDLIHHFTEQERPDLILIDLRLPDNRGLEVLSAANAHEACAQVPTLVITSSVYDQDVAQSYQLGASAVLSKPLSRASLREELVRIGSLAPNHSRMRATSH